MVIYIWFVKKNQSIELMPLQWSTLLRENEELLNKMIIGVESFI